MLGVTDGEWMHRPTEEVLWEPVSRHGRTAKSGDRDEDGAARSMPRFRPAAGGCMPIEGTYTLLTADVREAIIVAHPGGRERAPKPRLMDDVLSSIPEAVVIVHGNHVLYTNPSFSRMFGYTAEEVSGAICAILLSRRRVNWRTPCWRKQWTRRAMPPWRRCA